MRLLTFEFHFIFGCTREGKGKGSGVKQREGKGMLSSLQVLNYLEGISERGDCFVTSEQLNLAIQSLTFVSPIASQIGRKQMVGQGGEDPSPSLSFPLFLPNRTKENSYLSSLPFPSNQTQLEKLLLALLCLHCVQVSQVSKVTDFHQNIIDKYEKCKQMSNV